VELKKASTKKAPMEKKSSLDKTGVKEKPSNKGKTTDKRVRKASSKENESPIKSDGKVVTNGSSIESHISITPPRQNSTEKNEEALPAEILSNNHESIPHQSLPHEDDLSRRDFDESKLPNGDVPHNNLNNSHSNQQGIEVEKETEIIKQPQDELAAIIDEEAEYRRKEKSSKRLSSKHRQKSVEDGSQEKQHDVQQQQQQQQQQQSQEQQNGAKERDKFQSGYKRESFDRPRTSLRPPSARPASSRPAAPRRRDKNVEIVLQPDESAKLGNINVKMENFSKELEDDGENLVIIEDPSASADSFMNERLTKNLSNESTDSITAADDHGHLVQQILDTEKNFEGALGMDGMESVKKSDLVRRKNIVIKISQFKKFYFSYQGF
jgi:TRAF3-interacting protein 1